MEMENYVAKLNEHAQRTRSLLCFEDVGSVGPDHIKTFTLRAVVNGKAYPPGAGKNKKEARQNAAKNALKGLLEEPVNSSRDEKYSVASSQQKEEISQSLSDICDRTKSLSVTPKGEDFTEKNFIGRVNEFCQRARLSYDYILEKRCGPPHNPQFFYKLVIHNKEYAVGEGKSAKEAKQNAAQLAWTALQEKSHSDCKAPFLSGVSDDAGSAGLSSPPSTQESCNTTSKSVPTASSDSVVFTDSSNPPKDEVQSPEVKPKIRIAANFPNACRSKEDIINFNNKNTGNTRSKKPATKSQISRFKSEYDSIMCLGKGAFGHVYKAKQKLLHKYFAVKIVRCKEKSLREVAALSDLHHCNIVRYFTCWLEDSGYQQDSTTDSGSSSQSTDDSSIKYLYIQMELCDTKTLRVWIDEKNIQNVKKSLRDSKRREESLTIAKQIVRGVEYIHSKNLIHRDLKPANIMFGQDGEVKIGDFGLVTAENDDDAENLIERTVYKGTPSYMAPEQKTRNTYDRKVDIFASGLIYFELLWNLPTGHERKDIWDDVRNQKPPQGFLQHFPLENQIIKSMLCPKPEERPEASKLKMDLEECTRALTLRNVHRDSASVLAVLCILELKLRQCTMGTSNCVAELQLYAHRTRCELHYEDLGSVGPDLDKRFVQRAVLDGKVYPVGRGRTKKEAKREAAKYAIICLLDNEHQDSVDPTSFTPTNYMCWLNEYGLKNKLNIRPVESTRLGPNNATKWCSFVVGEEVYPAVSGKTKKDAKNEAAKLVYDMISSSKTTETTDYSQTSTQQSVSDLCNRIRNLGLNSQLHSNKRRQRATNFIGLVDHYCQRTNCYHSYIEVRRCGPSINPQFFYKLVINNKEYPEAEGKTIKEAQQNAAQLAWYALQEQSDWDSKVSIRSTVSVDGASPTLSMPSTSLESPESPSQSMPVNTGASEMVTTPSNTFEVQMPLSPIAPEDDVPTRLSTPTSLESLTSSQSMPTDSSGSGVFTDSSSSSKEKSQHVDKDKNTGSRLNETSTQSRFASDFDPMECLGSGAFGCVFKVRHKLLERFYAVKIVRREEKSLREVGTLSDLLHLNIVRYYTFWMEDSGYQWDISSNSCSSSQSADNSPAKYLYIQMELCDTKTLKVWIDEKNAESPQDSRRREESLSIAQQIVSGVEYIHSKKHIHRDLKPDNILFGMEGEVKIGDFGLVTRDDDDDSALMERTGQRGTTSYMAPEQRKEKNYDRKVDIFALGLIYFELLWRIATGHERVEIWDDVRSQNLPEEFSVTFPQESRIITSLLCERPEDRPEASKLKAELDTWAQTFSAQNNVSDVSV
ncbi:interferon-induced, double-stranded RNA-activated protein kinase [Acanthopagrus schlegelii]